MIYVAYAKTVREADTVTDFYLFWFLPFFELAVPVEMKTLAFPSSDRKGKKQSN